tara:strand:- start:1377 stop:1481 length:105 start_codon:yes stop_codon:yes gene_type:complete
MIEFDQLVDKYIYMGYSLEMAEHFAKKEWEEMYE